MLTTLMLKSSVIPPICPYVYGSVPFKGLALI